MAANIKIECAIDSLMNESMALFQINQIEKGWLKLAEAHIISQPYPWLHTRVHWRMLKTGIRQSNNREIVGQLLRLLVAAPGSILGRYPQGNTGRSNVSMFLPMEISREIQSKIESLK